MKKVAIIAHGLSDGGAERVASTLANYYISIEYRVLYLAIYSDKKEYYLNENVEYKFIDVNGKEGISALIHRSFEISKKVNAFKADVAVSFVEHELLPLIISGIPVIPSLRNDPQSTERGLFRKLLRDANYTLSKKVVFQTKGAMDYFNKYVQKKGVIIRNPLKEGLPHWHEETHNKVFMTACRINTQKNIPMLLQAFSVFSKNHTEYMLEIYGEGPDDYRKELENLAKKLGIGYQVFFKGHTNQIHEKMCDSEGFFLTSDYEGLSNAMLEAMAVGIPCVCTDCPPGGAREVMREDAGILVPVGDIDALVVAMNKIADDIQLRRQLSKNEKYIRKELEKDKIFSQWKDVLL